jgi:hypothetical protein
MKTDTELEALLRATLATHAQEVRDAAAVPVARELHRPGRRWLPALIAAAVVLAVAIAVTVATGGRDRHMHQPVGPSPTTTKLTPSPSPTPHAARRISLNWFGMKKVPGWAPHLQLSEPGYRVLAMRSGADPDQPVGCNGCASASAYVFVFDRGRFAAAQHGVTNWKHVDVAGTTGYLGSMQWYPNLKHVVPTLAWQYRPGSWAMVQGVTNLGGTEQNLLLVAHAVEPTKAEPIRLPFVLGYIPSLPITEVMDERSAGYALTLTFGATGAPGSESQEMDFTVWPQAAGTGQVQRTAANRRTIGGVVGYYADGVADVPIPYGYIEFGVTHSDTTTPEDLHDMQRIMQTIQWRYGDGRTGWPPAEQAIP